ncbi:MAG TPA: ubiquinone/menaquinone biosynthesis methyltransferase, partial [Nautiliaceae bacterium]|nr:ubiquinone/menaquinone biosynthesis methyltransferase [Nautiliaceae bacterium]
WREKVVEIAISELKKDDLKILDVACGTGDMIEIWKKKKKDIKIYGLDPSKKMLKKAREKFLDVTFFNSFATNIPFRDNSLDAISISFGIRNVLEIRKAIKEFERVLKKDGVVVVLEFVKAKNSNTFRRCIDFYSNKFLPKIGGVLSKNRQAYEYLPSSIENFFTKKELISLFEEENFKIVKYKEFNFGQVGGFVFKKI